MTTLESKVCAVFGVTPDNLATTGRKREWVDARHAYIFFLHKKCGMNQRAIEAFTGIDRTTVIHIVKKVNALAATDADYRGKLIDLGLEKHLST